MRFHQWLNKLNLSRLNSKMNQNRTVFTLDISTFGEESLDEIYITKHSGTDNYNKLVI